MVGEQRLALLGTTPQMEVRAVALDPHDPARRRLGALTYLGGVTLRSRDPAFGGFSSLVVTGDRFLLLSDGGNFVRFRMGADWRPHGLRFGNLPAGPSVGWQKQDRDSESLARDPRTGALWVGFERYNQIWRYTPTLPGRRAMSRPAPWHAGPAMAAPSRWRICPMGDSSPFPKRRRCPKPNDGDEGRRRADTAGADLRGRSAALSAPPFHLSGVARSRRRRCRRTVRRIAGRRRAAVSTAVPIPESDHVGPGGGDRTGASGAGQAAGGPDAPLIHDNFEGVAVTREGGATILWLVSDDNQTVLERTYLLKFRLDQRPAAGAR